LPIHWGAEQQVNWWKVSGLKSLQKFWVWNFILLGGDFGCSKFPSWLAAFAPLNSMLIEEKAWNAYTKCKTGWSLSWPLYVGTRFQHNFFTTRECGFSHKRSCGSWHWSRLLCSRFSFIHYNTQYVAFIVAYIISKWQFDIR
jgi:hypothetical protein